MKKALLIAAIAFCAITFAAPTHAYYYPKQGDLVKNTHSSAVYYVDGNNTRHLFPTEGTFFTWYSGSWNNQSIITLTDYEFNQLSSGRNVTVKPGSRVLRFDNSLVMYAVLPTGKLCHASYNYGNYQYNRAIVVPTAFQSDYLDDGVCDVSYNSNLPDGSLIRYQNSSDIYYIQNGTRRKVTTYGFRANNFRYESVLTDISWSISYPEGTIIDGRDPNISDIAYNLSDYGSGGYFNFNDYKIYNYTCSENWTCGVYSNCSNNSQYRSCWDSNNCGTTKSKPATSQSCYSYNYTCTPNWTCGSWTSCAYGNQYRNCSDLNNCNSTYNKPVTTQTCAACSESWTCGSWGTCQGSGSTGWQYRTCYDRNSCGTTASKPTTSQTCNLCSENWSCTSWTKCSNHYQSRSCVDVNSCGTSSGKPSTYQYCY